MNSVVYHITWIALLVPLVFPCFFPLPLQRKAAIDAYRRGWSWPVVLVTRTTPYLTLHTQAWIFAALHTRDPELVFTAHTLSLGVFVLYHGFNLINPMLLAHHPEPLVRKVTAVQPPLSDPFLLLIWLGLHLQHSFFPFYFFFQDFPSKQSLMPVFVLGGYIVWQRVCWAVQDVPAYPVLEQFRQQGYEYVFYQAGVAVVACYCSF